MDNYDDENFDDGFDEEALASRLDTALWRKLFAYAPTLSAGADAARRLCVLTACCEVRFR